MKTISDTLSEAAFISGLHSAIQRTMDLLRDKAANFIESNMKNYGIKEIRLPAQGRASGTPREKVVSISLYEHGHRVTCAEKENREKTYVQQLAYETICSVVQTVAKMLVLLDEGKLQPDGDGVLKY